MAKSKPDLTYLSLGAGVQSTTLYLLADQGELGEKPDVAIFADTKAEPPWVYDNLERLKAGGTIPIDIVSAGDLGSSIRAAADPTCDKRFVTIPFWVLGENGRGVPGRRQCTREYKIEPIKAHARKLLGLEKGERAAGRFVAEEWLGISLEERSRCKSSRYSWIQSRWPLIEKRWTRADCEAYLGRIGFGSPGKSSCVFCPYRHTSEYARWKRDEPELFEIACQWDAELRQGGAMRGMQNPSYIARELLPLAEAVEALEQDRHREPELFDGLFDECDGMCGV